MLKKLSLLMLVALIGIVASGTIAWGGDITGITYQNVEPKDYVLHQNKPCATVTVKGDFGGKVHKIIVAIYAKYQPGSSYQYVTSQSIITNHNYSFLIPRIFIGETYTDRKVKVYLYNVNGKLVDQEEKFYQERYIVTNVYPGDTNNDGVVNAKDILPIGFYWAKVGFKRVVNPDTTWGQKKAAEWKESDAIYADANGDGVVNGADVLAVGENWGKSWR